jgi:hypothetical protein
MKWERNLAWSASGAERQEVISHLAARLWKLANSKLDQIRLLEEGQRTSGVRGPIDKIAALRREASAHLQECVTLLQGVLEAPNPPRMAKVRLAHYLRELDPAAAVPLIAELLEREPKGPRREGLALDLAQLHIRAGSYRQAAALFPDGSPTPSSPRGRLLRILAQVGLGGRLSERAIRDLLADCGGAEKSHTTAIVANLPAILAASARPGSAFFRLDGAPHTCRRHRDDRLAVELVQRLVALGRVGSARSLVKALRRAGRPVAFELEEQVSQLAGPFMAYSIPPGDARLGRLIEARLRAVVLCAAPEVPVKIVFRLQVDPSGRVRLVPAQDAGREASNESSRIRGNSGFAALAKCLRAAAPRWRMPPWRAEETLELSVSLTIRPAARRRSPPTDPR